ncbi:hypothetical protein N7505_004983 [Penicillium chrysogenum]|uniref:polynucleotide adenylyltransferase n=1 Tax=Penicillium chrysogenum TaxID=5076 RepID=A0ABQ8WGN7_PENCH|nr:hypothetical protein N7505_004983 [Penicillium chrysogenum]
MPPPFQFRGNSNHRGSRPNPRHEFTFRYQKPATSERPLLSSKRESPPERLDGESKPEFRFAPLSALSDSEEAEMDMSDESDAERPRKRRALALDGPQETAPAPPPVPKWSNPDPYTALPPPAETTNKRVDVVKLIRKARLDVAPKTDETDAVKQNSDFISLGMGFETEVSESNAPENAPKGPKAQEALDPAIASRKRTRGDELKGYSRKTGKPASRFNYDGSVIDQWKPLSPETGTPWFEGTPVSLHVGTQLHNEILSFYHWAKPQEFEHIVRADLVNRLETVFKQRYHNVSIRAFGSFASGLYLPTADIDLVLLSNTFLRTGVRTFGERKGQIYAFSNFLQSTNLAVPNSIECIASARVPILKYVDKLTGLRVDLSFDNDSGLIANDTFQKWKTQYPMMPVILAVIKQFLLIRGLNEVPTGGLGGFSITCLVTSLLQHLPQGHMQPNLATILLDFFNFYGKQFSYDRLAIRMDPPGYFNKPANHVKQGYYFGNPDRLTIEDPNNRDNDISGGTKEIGLIFRAFSNAHTALRNRMEYLALVQGSNKSILEPIIAANFDEYIEQRFQLRQHPPARKPAKKPKSKLKGTKSEPEDISSDEAPGPEAKSAKTRKGETRRQLCQERAARLKRLRPDLKKLPNTLSLRQARRHAGYETDEQMNADLDRREKLLTSD